MADKYFTDLEDGLHAYGDEILSVAMNGADVLMIANTLSALESDNSYNDSAAGFVAAGFAEGDRIYAQVGAGSIFVGTIETLTTSKMVIASPEGDAIADQAAGSFYIIGRWDSLRLTSRQIALAMPQVVTLYVNGPGDAVSAGDGAWYYRVPWEFDGFELYDCSASLVGASSLGNTVIQLRNVTQAADMLLDPIQIDQGDTDSEVSGSYRTIDEPQIVNGRDMIAIDIDGAGSDETGLSVELVFGAAYPAAPS